MSILTRRQARELPPLQVATIIIAELEGLVSDVLNYSRPLSLPAAAYPLLDDHYQRMRQALALIEELRGCLGQKECSPDHQSGEREAETATSNLEVRVSEDARKSNNIEEQLEGLRNFQSAARANGILPPTYGAEP